MKRVTPFLLLILLNVPLFAFNSESWIRVNQAGYLPNDIKVAVFISLKESTNPKFTLYDAITNKPVMSGNGRVMDASDWA